jgi:hypothetical protein
MGCGVGRVMDIGIGIIKSNKTFNIQNDIKSKFITVYRNNPFYTMSLSKLISLTENFEKNSKSMHDYILSLDNIDNITKAMIKEVYDTASSKLQFVFPKESYEKTVLFFIILFMAKPIREEIKKEKKKLILILLDNTRDNKDKSKFLSGKFSFLITNLINFISNLLIYCLLSIVILQTFDKFNYSEIEKLLVNKIIVKNISPDNIKEYYEKKFEKINPKLKSSMPIIDCCLPYIFEPIKDLVQGQEDVESVVISELEIEDIVSRIMFLHDPYNFIDIFLTLKIKDY